MSLRSRQRQKDRERERNIAPISLAMPKLTQKQKWHFLPFIVAVILILGNGLFCFFSWFGTANILLSQCILAVFVFLLAKESVQDTVSRIQYGEAIVVIVLGTYCAVSHSWTGGFSLVYMTFVVVIVLLELILCKKNRKQIEDKTKIAVHIFMLLLLGTAAFFTIRQSLAIWSLRWMPENRISDMVFFDGQQRRSIIQPVFRETLLNGICTMVPLYSMEPRKSGTPEPQGYDLSITLKSGKSFSFQLYPNAIKNQSIVAIIVNGEYYQSRRLYPVIQQLIESARREEE